MMRTLLPVWRSRLDTLLAELARARRDGDHDAAVYRHGRLDMLNAILRDVDAAEARAGDPPPFLGGQGRSSDDIEGGGAVLVATLTMSVVAGLLGFLVGRLL